MASRYLIETSAVDGYLLEDGSGVLILDVIEPKPFTGLILGLATPRPSNFGPFMPATMTFFARVAGAPPVESGSGFPFTLMTLGIGGG